MSFIAAAIIGSAVVGGVTGLIASSNASGAAKEAAGVQSAAANQATGLQKDIFDQTKAGLAPFVNFSTGQLPNALGLVPGATDTNGNPVAPTPALGAVQSLLPGANNPLTSAALSFVPGSGVPPSPALTNLQNIGDPNNPVSTAARSFVPGSGVAPTAALANLQSVTGASNPLNSTLARNTAQGSAASLTDINNRYHEDYNKAIRAGKTEADIVGSDMFKQYQNELNNYYANDASQSEVDQQLAYQKGRVDDPLYGDSAKALTSTLANRQNAGTPANQSLALSAVNSFLPNGAQAGPAVRALQSLTPGAANPNAALSSLNALLGLGGPGSSPDPKAIQAALEATPGYQFTLAQGLKAVTNSNAAKGLGSSGAALRGAADYATGLAGATYEQRLTDYLNNYNSQFTNAQNAYTGQGTQALNTYSGQNTAAQNQLNSQITNALNTFSGQSTPALNTLNSLTANAQGVLSGQQAPTLNTLNSQTTNAQNAYQLTSGVQQNLLSLGENAGAQTGQIGVATGGNLANTITGGAAAQAGGIVGSSNALTNGLVNAGNQIGNSAVSLALLHNVNPTTPAATNPLSIGTYNPVGATPANPVLTGMYA